MNNDLMGLLQQSLGGNAIGQIAQQIGASPQQTQQGIQAALPMMLGAMSQNAQGTQGGPGGLLGMLDRDGDGNPLNDLAGLLGGGAAAGLGGSILSQVFGNKQDAACDSVAKSSGLNAGQAAGLLAVLGPLIMGALSKAKAGGVDPGAALSQGAQQAQQGGVMGMLTGFLDKDKDGNILDDLAQKALGGQGGAAGGLGGLLGGLLGGKK